MDSRRGGAGRGSKSKPKMTVVSFFKILDELYCTNLYIIFI